MFDEQSSKLAALPFLPVQKPSGAGFWVEHRFYDKVVDGSRKLSRQVSKDKKEEARQKWRSTSHISAAAPEASTFMVHFWGLILVIFMCYSLEAVLSI